METRTTDQQGPQANWPQMPGTPYMGQPWGAPFGPWTAPRRGQPNARPKTTTERSENPGASEESAAAAEAGDPTEERCRETAWGWPPMFWPWAMPGNAAPAGCGWPQVGAWRMESPYMHGYYYPEANHPAAWYPGAQYSGCGHGAPAYAPRPAPFPGYGYAAPAANYAWPTWHPGQGPGYGYGLGYGQVYSPGYGYGLDQVCSPGYGYGQGQAYSPGHGYGLGRGQACSPGYGYGQGYGYADYPWAYGYGPWDARARYGQYWNWNQARAYFGAPYPYYARGRWGGYEYAPGYGAYAHPAQAHGGWPRAWGEPWPQPNQEYMAA